MQTVPLTEDLIAEAVGYLDRILTELAVRFVHLDRGQLVERMEEIRVEAAACRTILTERRTMHME